MNTQHQQQQAAVPTRSTLSAAPDSGSQADRPSADPQINIRPLNAASSRPEQPATPDGPPRLMGDAAPPSGAQRRDALGLGAAAVNRTFLSPRVLDEAAFTEFADRLRAVLEDAAERASEARDAAAAAAAERDELKALLRKQHQQMEIATKLLKVATDKCATVAASVDAVEAKAAEAVNADQRVEAALAEKAAAFDSQLRYRLEAFEAALDRRASELGAAADSAADGVAHRLDAHATELRSDLVALVDEAREQATRSADELRDDLERRLAREAAALEGLLATAAAARGDLQQLLQGDGALDLAQIKSTCERAFTLAGLDPITGEPMTEPEAHSLLCITDRADRARRDADSVMRRLTGLVEDAHRRTLDVAKSVHNADAALDAIEHRRSRLESSLNAARRAAIQTKADLDGQLASAERAAEPLTEVLGRVDAASERADSLLGQSQKLAEAAEPLTRDLTVVVESAESLAATLAPWRALLLECDAEPCNGDQPVSIEAASLPKPLRDIVDAVRANIIGDLTKMAGAMSLIADRAAAEIVKPTTPGAKPGIKITPR